MHRLSATVLGVVLVASAALVNGLPIPKEIFKRSVDVVPGVANAAPATVTTTTNVTTTSSGSIGAQTMVPSTMVVKSGMCGVDVDYQSDFPFVSIVRNLFIQSHHSF